jgi:hypothetical protein
VKPPEINDILLKFKECRELRYTAKSFLTDKIEDNMLWLIEMFQKGLNPHEVSLSYAGRKNKSLRQKYPNYVFKVTQITDLESKLKNKDLYLDNAFRKDALEKIERIKTLRIKRFAYIKSEDATLDEIRVYLKKVDQYENIDMDNERDLA